MTEKEIEAICAIDEARKLRDQLAELGEKLVQKEELIQELLVVVKRGLDLIPPDQVFDEDRVLIQVVIAKAEESK